MADCPICRRNDADVERDTNDTSVNCPRCGKFVFKQGAAVLLMQIGDADREYCSAWVRNEHVRLNSPPLLLRAGLEQVLDNKRKRAVSEQQDSLLLNLGRQSPHPGYEVPVLGTVDFGLAWAKNDDELEFHLNALADAGFIESNDELNPRYKLTSAGWRKYSELESPIGPDSNLVFVAMSFDSDLNSAWQDGIRPALVACGYDPRRVDTGEHIGKIDDCVMAMIRESRFTVADVTRQNRGAYFEAGFALGLGRPVIWTVHSDDLANAHFDTRQFNHVVWSNIDDLRTKLEARVLGALGRWKA